MVESVLQVNFKLHNKADHKGADGLPMQVFLTPK